MYSFPPQAIIVTAIAVTFDFLNGLNDSSNIVATMIASRALSPRRALLLASVAVFVAPFLFGVAVATTIGSEIVDPVAVTFEVIIASLVGAIVWNLVTWYFGLPSSSSHALVGGILGSVVISTGPAVIQVRGTVKVLVSLLIAPALGLVCGYIVMKVTLFLSSGASPRVNSFFKRGQMVTALALALGHGTNGAQKSMGIITMALVTLGVQSHFAVPNWVVLVCALSIALGTALGGWRIIRTLGSGFYRIRPIHGFTAQVSSATVILIAVLLGGPVSSTQVISSAIVGVGAAERVSKVRWGVVGNIISTWVVTVPASALIGAITYALITAIS